MSHALGPAAKSREHDCYTEGCFAPHIGVTDKMELIDDVMPVSQIATRQITRTVCPSVTISAKLFKQVLRPSFHDSMSQISIAISLILGPSGSNIIQLATDISDSESDNN